MDRPKAPHRSMFVVASMVKRASPSARSALLEAERGRCQDRAGRVCIGGCDIDEQARNQSGTLAPCPPGT